MVRPTPLVPARPVKPRVIGVGEVCPGCGSTDTRVRNTLHPSERRYPAHIAERLRVRYHVCAGCEVTFKTEG